MTTITPVADFRGSSHRVLFENNSICADLFGEHHVNIAHIEEKLPVSIVTRGNEAFIQGRSDGDVVAAASVLQSLYKQLQDGHQVGRQEVDAALRMVDEDGGQSKASRFELLTEKRSIRARSFNQAAYLKALNAHDLVFGLGPAGTGKTYLAVAAAMAQFKERRIDRIVLSRPAVEAGERLGFLPGDLKDKVDPYLRPLYDALHDMMPEAKLAQRLDSDQIEVAPLAFMRGRTLSNAFVILDEAQNTTSAQMKMFLTRLGENSRMVVTGDPTQVDLPQGQKSGLVDAVQRLSGIENVAIVRFDRSDVVRHHLVTQIIEAYERRDMSSNGPKESKVAGGDSS